MMSDPRVEACLRRYLVFALLPPIPADAPYEGLLIEIALLARRSLMAADDRPIKLAATLILVLRAHRLHARIGELDRSAAHVVLSGDYLMSAAFKLLAEIGNVGVIASFADTSLSMAEGNVRALQPSRVLERSELCEAELGGTAVVCAARLAGWPCDPGLAMAVGTRLARAWLESGGRVPDAGFETLDDLYRQLPVAIRLPLRDIMNRAGCSVGTVSPVAD